MKGYFGISWLKDILHKKFAQNIDYIDMGGGGGFAIHFYRNAVSHFDKHEYPLNTSCKDMLILHIQSDHVWKVKQYKI